MNLELLHSRGIFYEENSFLGQSNIKIEPNKLLETLAIFKEEFGYKVLMDLTAVDYLLPSPSTKIVYWLHHPDHFHRVRIAVYAGRNASIPTVVSLWEGAAWYERELYDLFGVRFEGHQNIKRILMPDDWVGHPLRKDYPLTEEPVEFKHGVKPKIPSEIITHVKTAKN